MIAKKYRLSKQKDFKKIMKEGKYAQKSFFNVRMRKNKLKHNRFAVVISKKVIPKAAERNRIRRQIMEIIRASVNSEQEGLDYVFFVNKRVMQAGYQNIKSDVEKIIQHKVK